MDLPPCLTGMFPDDGLRPNAPSPSISSAATATAAAPGPWPAATSSPSERRRAAPGRGVSTRPGGGLQPPTMAAGELSLDFGHRRRGARHGEGRSVAGDWRPLLLPAWALCVLRRALAGQLSAAPAPARKIDGAGDASAWAMLGAAGQKAHRQAWPGVRIVFRGDRAVGLPPQDAWPRAPAASATSPAWPSIPRLAGSPRRGWRPRSRLRGKRRRSAWSDEFAYAAGTWKRTRRVIARIEHGPKGANPATSSANLEGGAQELYDEAVCARRRHGEPHRSSSCDLFADRTSCHVGGPASSRLLLSSLAYTLLETIRRIGLAGTDMARAQAGTWPGKLLKSVP